jgi:NADPH:quinone reductase-like Zn-dependent oxidoreductase
MLAPLGRLVFYGMSTAMPGSKRAWLRAWLALRRTRRIHPLSLVEPNVGVFGVHLLHLGAKEDLLRNALADILQRVSDGELRPITDRTFPLTRDGAVEAHSYIHARKNIGKVVLTNAEAVGSVVEPPEYQ